MTGEDEKSTQESIGVSTKYWREIFYKPPDNATWIGAWANVSEFELEDNPIAKMYFASPPISNGAVQSIRLSILKFIGNVFIREQRERGRRGCATPEIQPTFEHRVRGDRAKTAARRLRDRLTMFALETETANSTTGSITVDERGYDAMIHGLSRGK